MYNVSKYNPLFLLASAASLYILVITPDSFDSDYIVLLDRLCLVGILLNGYLYATKRSGHFLTVAALCQLVYCLGASVKDIEEEFAYTRLDCLRGLKMHPVGADEMLETAALPAALLFVALEEALLVRLLVSFGRTRQTRERN